MAANALIDTGAILALLDGSDAWHRTCADTLRQFRLPLLTSEAVLTEVFHLVGDRRHQRAAAWTFIRSGAVEVAVIETPDLREIETLMTRYWDRPMDFADATLA